MPTFAILGAIEIRNNDRVARLGGIMQQTLLGSLLVCGGAVVTINALMEELWGTTPPAKAENALQAQISRLRRRLALLEPGRSEPRLTTGASGYLLDVGRAELDAWVFQDVLEKIRAQAEVDLVADSQTDVAELRRVLGLWRGPMFGGLTGGTMCQTAARKFHESRNAALGLLLELELKNGGHGRILPELSELCAQNPMHEQFCVLLMLALYRSGRQIDALNHYRQFRYRLTEQLGVEPSPTVSRYERAILTHDPILLRNEPFRNIYSEAS